MSFKLNVPFIEKDAAKREGARWNATGKYWFYPGDVLPDALRRWYIPEVEEMTLSTKNAVCTDDEVIQNQSTGPIGTRFLHIDLQEDSDPFKSVTQVNQMIETTFRRESAFQTVMVKGEVTNYSGPNNGNYYFAIKDEYSLLNCFMWRSDAEVGLDFELEKGQQIAIIGNLEFYTNQGKSQLHARRITNVGDGAAKLALLQLRERLRVEGLFDAEHKKALPKHPSKVGIVTSKDGKAIGDICKVAKSRNPYIQLILYHVSVQGKRSVPTVVEGIKAMDQMGLDVIIVCRGGGSDEELMAYNDEAIARAVYEANTPIVSAVGHEAHWTLIDETADLRTATPSHAAMAVCPDVMTDVNRLLQIRKEMAKNMENCIIQKKLLLEAKRAFLEKNNPERKLKEQQDKLTNLKKQLVQSMQKLYEDRVHRYEMLVTKLHGLSPTAKLVNGFGYIAVGNKPLVSVNQVTLEDELQITIHDGEISAKVSNVRVKEIEKNES